MKTKSKFVPRIEINHKREAANLRKLIAKIADALATSDTGINLVNVARLAHRAEVELQAIKRAPSYMSFPPSDTPIKSALSTISPEFRRRAWRDCAVACIRNGSSLTIASETADRLIKLEDQRFGTQGTPS